MDACYAARFVLFDNRKHLHISKRTDYDGMERLFFDYCNLILRIHQIAL